MTSGVRLDVAGLVESPAALTMVPLFLLALLLARGLPALLYLRQLGSRGTLAAALLQATSLPFIVTATQIGVLIGLITPVTATSLTCAGLLSVLFFPAIAVALLNRPTGDVTAEVPATTTGERRQP